MKKTELKQDPIDRQTLWLKVRTSKTTGSNAFKLVPVVAKSLWHRGNSGVDERYLTVAEYHQPNRQHSVHLQALQAMTIEESAQFPLTSAAPKDKPMLRRKDLAKRLAKRVKVSEANALAWFRHIEEELSLALGEGHVITLRGFAKFSTAIRKPQNAHHIATGGIMKTVPRRRLVIKGGDVLHRRLAEAS